MLLCSTAITVLVLQFLLVADAVADTDAVPEDDGSRDYPNYYSPARRLGQHQRHVHFPPFLPTTHEATATATATDRVSTDDDEAEAPAKDAIPDGRTPPNCTELYFEQRMDHFGPSPGTYMQRYFVSDVHYGNNARGDDGHGDDDGDGGSGPMFFYLGNEADVTLYVNATGLIWENAEEFGALVVFAEHRYYGKSQLFPNDDKDILSNSNHLQYLSADQALMDYVALVEHLKKTYNLRESDAVIGFGGSYGGMLASWARFRYPYIWDGAIAASAPILAFEGMEDFFDPNFFAKGLMYDVSTKAGVRSEFCEVNLRKAFGEEKALLDVDPARLRSSFRVCDNDTTTDVDLGVGIMNWLNDALAYMSMGNFPYPSGYILNGNGVLPAFPVRVACEYLVEDITSDDKIGDWLTGLASFASVYYNYTTNTNTDTNAAPLPCNRISVPVNNESSIVDTLWDYQYCSQIFMVGGQGPDKNDIYWDEPWDGDGTAERCREKYGFQPDRNHVAFSYGTPRDWAKDASNIVWSQGEYDPWRGGGVVDVDDADLNDSLIAFVIPKAAHHLDLFFSHPNDTKEVIAARRREVNEIRRWIEEKKRKHARARTHTA
jgi:lysosomal Pro-X carboxypeptidase